MFFSLGRDVREVRGQDRNRVPARRSKAGRGLDPGIPGRCPDAVAGALAGGPAEHRRVEIQPKRSAQRAERAGRIGQHIGRVDHRRGMAQPVSLGIKQLALLDHADIGVVQQSELFDAEADRLGHAPPVIDAADVLADPARTLGALCAALGLDFDPAMLSWPAGKRASDGVWAPAWYAGVEASTGFAAPGGDAVPVLPAHLADIAAEAEEHYRRLAAYRL